ncbi:hypothetical protein SAICODRAFT_20790 [Saitoella complicata NRRL Y-17804]|nr:uncharacterized protein SAICODRAFT_20790 [Saitoella complicata NRRL Y-17804]ODQ51426.1 hypothetical protein SAICODRAFT_20790 [Saitoella complicata NRRL Y-17804]
MPGYERVPVADEADHQSSIAPPATRPGLPDSPPPSFREAISQDAELDAAFNNPDAEEESEDEDQHAYRLHGRQPNQEVERVTLLQQSEESSTQSTPAACASGRTQPRNHNVEGVFSNLSAKPEVETEKVEEHPPTYDEASSDQAPPYWETTIIAPGMSSDDVFVDGLPVGNVFSFVWNMLISMSFQFVGFLLTYLLHTSHASAQGAKAGLGITLIQYGFYLQNPNAYATDFSSTDPFFGTPIDPTDPNSALTYTGDAATVPPAVPSGTGTEVDAISGGEWLSYVLMVAGWFLLIRSISEFFRVRKLEELVRQTPTRPGDGPAVVREGEGENAV